MKYITVSILLLFVFALAAVPVPGQTQVPGWYCECPSTPPFPPADCFGGGCAGPGPYDTETQCNNCNISGCGFDPGQCYEVADPPPPPPPVPIPTTDPPSANNDNVKGLVDPLGNRTLPQIIGGGIRIGLGVVGAIALALFVYGGFIWMTAAGNTSRVQKGREVLVWATIGLIVIFTSYAVLNFILGAITGSG